MSQDLYEQRLGHVERDLSDVRGEMRVMGNDVSGLKGAVGSVASDVKQLLERDARRPEAATWPKVLGTLAVAGAAIGGIGGFVWWIIATSPVIEQLKDADRRLERRVERLDDDDIGRVSRIEQRLDQALARQAAEGFALGAADTPLARRPAAPAPGWQAKVGD